MAGHRMQRVNEDIKREISAIIRDVKDPRVADSGMISVLRVDTTADMSYTTVYISSISGMEQTKQVVQGLDSAHGFIRRRLGAALKLRKMPELRFVADDSIAFGADLNQKLKTLIKDEKEQQI